MGKQVWNQLSEIFQAALNLENQERADYLRSACGDDGRLLDRVQELLDAFDGADKVGFIGATAIESSALILLDDRSMAGTMIGRHLVIKRLGTGGMGEVFLGTDTTLDRPVAIKVLLPETAMDKERIRRFAQEARAASSLNHPNILTVYEVGDHKGSRFIATEFIEGETLRDRLNRGSVKRRDLLDIAIQTSAALDAAHAAGITHRDIKPENIMVRNDGLVKVLDFGIAKLSGPSAETQEFPQLDLAAGSRDVLQTRAGTIIGTVAYMSPEQTRGHSVDSRSDIWSLGVVMYEMATGRQPFVGETATEITAAIRNATPDLLSDVPPEITQIIEKALEKNADKRYQDVKDLAADLRNLRQELEFAAKIGSARIDPAITGQRPLVSAEIRPRTSVLSVEFLTRTIRDRKSTVAGVLLAFAFASALIYYFGARIRATESNKGRFGSVAVLPFINGSGDAALEYLSDGVTDSLTNSLSQLPELTVKARSSVFQYKGKEVSPQTIGSELSVQTALFGRVTQLNGVLTLSLELVDTKTGDRIWGEIYTRKQTDLISLQREIARDVAKKLGTRLSDAEERRAVKNGTEDPEAHNLYLQGLYELNKRTTVDIRKSITLFEQATQKDPNYAIAYASLASAYLTLVPYSAGLSREEANGLASKAHEVAARAEEIDDSLPEVHAILGSIDDDDWKFADAENEYKRAIALNPNDASTRLSYSLNLSYRARYPEALAEINKAYELDPFSRSVAFNVGARLNEARRFDEAIAQLKRVLEIEPDHSLTHFVLSEVLEAEGRYAEAISELRVADVLLEKTSPEVADRKAAALTNALRSGGIEAYWKKRLKFCLEEYDKGNGLAYRNAIAYARLGEKDRAFEQLEKSFANHELYLPWLRSEPAFDSMIDDPRFTDIVQRMGLD